MTNEYHSAVGQMEGSLRKCAKHSFEPFSSTFVDGKDIFQYYADQWQTPNQLKLKHRTPLQLERDRVLYSPIMRKQTEKYHVLYNGQRRIVRAYATHTMKMAQVARAMARGLDLNQDFAEAIALGAKIGSVPFIHAAKKPLAKWAESKLRCYDEGMAQTNPRAEQSNRQLELYLDGADIPDIINTLQSSVALEKVKRFMPWAAGQREAKLYSSGQEGYWLLCTNPYTIQTRTEGFFPETMYGIWRHTRGSLPCNKKKFLHKVELAGAENGYNRIADEHATFEAIIVQYADDITWVIENLNDANDVALLNKSQTESVYAKVYNEVKNLDTAFDTVILKSDPGGLYTYFIGEFVKHSSKVLQADKDGADLRKNLSEGDPDTLIGLTPEATAVLDKLVKFLNESIFIEPRTNNRSEMLRSIIKACIDIIYSSEQVLEQAIDDQSRLQGWENDEKKRAMELLDDQVHRIQLSMDILASWGDQEIYDFVGIQSL